MKIFKCVFACLLGSAVMLPVSTVHAQAKNKAKIVCWNDNAGVRYCGDRVPPEFAKKERNIYDAQGRVVQVKEREKTEEELVQEAEQKRLVKVEQEKVEEQARYDRYLIQAYQTVADLERTRDERLRAVRGRLLLAEKSVDEIEVALNGLRDRRSETQREFGTTPQRLLQQIEEFENNLIDALRARQRSRESVKAVEEEFARDIDRYKQLKAASNQQRRPAS